MSICKKDSITTLAALMRVSSNIDLGDPEVPADLIPHLSRRSSRTYMFNHVTSCRCTHIKTVPMMQKLIHRCKLQLIHAQLLNIVLHTSSDCIWKQVLLWLSCRDTNLIASQELLQAHLLNRHHTALDGSVSESLLRAVAHDISDELDCSVRQTLSVQLCVLPVCPNFAWEIAQSHGSEGASNHKAACRTDFRDPPGRSRDPKP